MSNRLKAIITHLKAIPGCQHVGDVGDKIATDKFTEYSFRGINPPVRVRVWNYGMIEVLFVQQELCAGDTGDAPEKMPDLEWVLDCISKHTKPYKDAA